MSNGAPATHDFYADTFDTIDGEHYIWSAKNPDRKFRVVSLLNRAGDETTNPDLAAGGVVELAMESYTTFLFR